jgi:hypothetical protein
MSIDIIVVIFSTLVAKVARNDELLIFLQEDLRIIRISGDSLSETAFLDERNGLSLSEKRPFSE